MKAFSHQTRDSGQKKKIVGLDVSQVKPASWCLKVLFTVTCTGCKEKKSHSRHSTREIRQYLNHKIYFLSAIYHGFDDL